MTSKTEYYTITRKVTLVGSVIDAVLSVLKIVVGLIGSSQALVADGVHSFSDLVTDILLIWAAKHAQAAPDEEHPYGHQRIETIATIALSIALLAVAIGFASDAVTRLIDGGNLKHPGWMVLLAALASVVSKEWIYHYTLRAAVKINSDMLRANAWHSRSDAASSIIVILGVIGVMLGFEYADALASIGVSLMIGWIGWSLGREGIEELIDSSVDRSVREQILDAIRHAEGVTDVHQVRTRKMAGNIVMDTHITVHPRCSVSEGHRIGDAVERTLRQSFSTLSDITIHIDYEDDATQRLGYELPLRKEVLEDVEKVFRENIYLLDDVTLKDFSEVQLHYLDGQIQLELWSVWPSASKAPILRDKEALIAKALETIHYISDAKLIYHSETHN